MKLPGTWIRWIFDLETDIPDLYVEAAADLDGDEPSAYFAGNPAVLAIYPALWLQAPPPLRLERFVRELAHHAYAAHYDARPGRYVASSARRQEARGHRQQLQHLADSHQVLRAACQGDRLPWELGTTLGRTDTFAQERAALLLAQRPELLPLLCPREPDDLDSLPF